MSIREGVETAVGRVLDATEGAQVTQALATFTKQAYPRYREDRASIDRKNAVVSGERQVLSAAADELTCRQVVANMSASLQTDGTLRMAQDYEPGSEFDEAYEFASPSLRRFLATLDFGFRPALESVLEEGRNGIAPASAILAAGSLFQERYRAIRQEWIDTSNQPQAKFLHSMGIQVQPVFDKPLTSGILESLNVAAKLIIGRAVAYDSISTGLSQTEFALSQFHQIALFSGADQSISLPILNEPDLSKLYALWENGELSESEFRQQASASPLVAPDACYHKSLAHGGWKNRRHCSADVPFMRPHLFSIDPGTTLGQLGVDPIPERISMVHIFLAGAMSIGDIIYDSWPAE